MCVCVCLCVCVCGRANEEPLPRFISVHLGGVLRDSSCRSYSTAAAEAKGQQQQKLEDSSSRIYRRAAAEATGQQLQKLEKSSCRS